MKIRSYKDLRIWKEAHSLTLAIYRVSCSFPREERYSITSQIRRSASSVAANIVEGTGRDSTNALVNFLNIARGSAKETAYFCQLARDLGYFPASVADRLIHRYEGLDAGINAAIHALKSQQ